MLRLLARSTKHSHAPKRVRAAESTAMFSRGSRHVASHLSCRGRGLAYLIPVGQNVKRRKGGERGRSFSIRYVFFVQHTTLAVDCTSLQILLCTTWSIYTSIYTYPNLESACFSDFKRFKIMYATHSTQTLRPTPHSLNTLYPYTIRSTPFPS